jgi:hypothetical protein
VPGTIGQNLSDPKPTSLLVQIMRRAAKSPHSGWSVVSGQLSVVRFADGRAVAQITRLSESPLPASGSRSSNNGQRATDNGRKGVRRVAGGGGAVAWITAFRESIARAMERKLQQRTRDEAEAGCPRNGAEAPTTDNGQRTTDKRNNDAELS